MTSIFAVVVTYNGENYIEKCLESLQESSVYTNILVVDNASKDSTVQLIKDRFGEVKLFELSVNLGFGRANNIGIKYAYDNGAEHIFLLNQDAYIENHQCLEKLAKYQAKNHKYGILSPLHLRGDKKKLDSRFSLFIGRSNDKDDLLTDFLVNKTTRNIYNIDFVNAAAWMLSRQCVEKVGLFNPSFVHYGEDEDFARRVNYFGFRLGIEINTNVVHDRPQGDGQISDRKKLQMVRADAIGRLSRVDLPIGHNLLSVLLRSLIHSPQVNSNFINRLIFTILNVVFIISKLSIIFKNRNISQNGECCFFNDADYDIKQYMKQVV